jgi:CheY-like chemotaxis protein
MAIYTSFLISYPQISCCNCYLVAFSCCARAVTAVLEPERALELFREMKSRVDQFDLVITDLHMPGMNVFELMELIHVEMDIPVIRKAFPQTPYFSVHGSDALNRLYVSAIFGMA